MGDADAGTQHEERERGARYGSFALLVENRDCFVILLNDGMLDVQVVLCQA